MASREKGFSAVACRPIDPPRAPNENIFDNESLQKVNCRLVYSSPDHVEEKPQSDMLAMVVDEMVNK